MMCSHQVFGPLELLELLGGDILFTSAVGGLARIWVVSGFGWRPCHAVLPASVLGTGPVFNRILARENLMEKPSRFHVVVLLEGR
jgi:hypothetical protein